MEGKTVPVSSHLPPLPEYSFYDFPLSFTSLPVVAEEKFPHSMILLSGISLKDVVFGMIAVLKLHGEIGQKRCILSHLTKDTFSCFLCHLLPLLYNTTGLLLSSTRLSTLTLGPDEMNKVDE